MLTGSVPGRDGVGAILVRQILEEIPRDKLRIITFTPRNKSSESLSANPWVDANFTRRYEPAYSPIGGAAGDLISYAAQATLGRNHLRKLADLCVQEGRGFQCQGVFAVLDNPSVIRIADRVSQRLKIPLYSFVMDDVDLQVNNYFYGGLLKANLVKTFNRTLRNSKSIAVAGESMQQAYRNRYGKEGSILRQGLPYTPAEASERLPIDSDVITIGFAGSMTARDAYEQLIAELDKRKWMLAGKKVVFRIIGSFLKLVPSGPQHIEYFGWRTTSELIRLTEECDFLYLPQSFSRERKEFTETSFPNKLCTYLPARRPILLHTPEYGSLRHFFRDYPCGPVSHQLDAGELLDFAAIVALDKARYRSYLESIESAFKAELNHARLKDQVRCFLSNISTEEME